MSNPQINPADLLGALGGLMGQGGENGFDLGKLIGGIFGDEDQSEQKPKRSTTPTVGRVVNDVATAAGSVGGFVKANLPKFGGNLDKAALTELLMDMLAEHDGFQVSAGKRESLYRATAAKWADKIIKQERPATERQESPASSERKPSVTVVPVTDAEEAVAVTVTVGPKDAASVPVPEEKEVTPASSAISEEALELVAELVHGRTHPDHDSWEICKERNISCRYETLGAALVLLKNPAKES